MHIDKIFLIICFIIEVSSQQYPHKTFSCGSGEYIENNQYCDGYPQCSDGSDEPTFCSSIRKDCDPGKYLCALSKTCIDADLLSDIRLLKLCLHNENRTYSEHDTTTQNSFYSFIDHLLLGAASSETSEFHCSNKRCVTVKQECPGYCDCVNCTDEEKYELLTAENGTNFTLTSCSAQKDKFMCYDNRRCLNLDYVCDGHCNCFDCSDESEDCSKFDSSILHDCPHTYYPTTDGPRCIEKLVSNLDECTDKHICDQKCTQYGGRAICSCFDGYNKIPHEHEGFRCQKNESSNDDVLIYSTPSQIKILNFVSDKVEIIKKSVECGTLTGARDFVYYTSDSDFNKIIFKYSLKSKTTTEELKSDNSISAMAVDYITNNLYFITNRVLSVCSNNPERQICIELACCNVRHIVLAPSYGWMFYTKTSTFSKDRFIMKSNMDGTNEEILVDGKYRIDIPLAIDESIRRVYWFDSNNNELISASFFDDRNEIRIFPSTNTIVSITALDSRVFFTKPGDHEIYIAGNNERYVKLINQNMTVTRYPSNPTSSGLLMISDMSPDSGSRLIEESLTSGVENLHAYNSAQQNTLKNKNPCTSCNGICLLRSYNSASGSGLAINCTCNDPILMSNPYWCNTVNLKEKTEKYKDEKVTTQIYWRFIQSTTRTPFYRIVNSSYQTPSTTPMSRHLEAHQLDHTSESQQSSNFIGLKAFFAIILMGVVMCGIWVMYYGWRRHMYGAQRQYGDQMNIYEQEDL